MANRGKCRVIVCLLTALFLAGCGKHSAAPGAATQKQVTLRFWHAMNSEGPRQAIQSAIGRFQAARPLVTVAVETFDADAYKEKLDAAMAGGTPPDVFFTSGGRPLLAMAKAGRVANLKQALAKDNWKERFLPAALDFCSDTNGAWGVPLEVSFAPVWYNTEICKDHRVKIPKTMAEFMNACRDLHGEGMIPLAMGNKERRPGAMLFAYLASRQGGTQLFLDAAARKEGAKFDDPAFVRAGDMFQMFARTKALPGGFADMDEKQGEAQFVKGQTAMYMGGMDFLARVKEEKPLLLEKMDCFPFPAVEGGKGDTNTVLGDVDAGFAVSAKCADIDKAVDLLRYLTAPETVADWCLLGRIPALQMEETSLSALPAPTRKALDILNKATKIQPFYDRHLPPRLAEECGKTTCELLAVTLTPEDAARRMEQCAQENVSAGK